MQSTRKRMLSDQRPLKVAGWGPDPNLAGTISVGDIYHLIAGARPIGRAVRTLGRNERTWRRTVQWDLNDVRILIIVRYQESSVEMPTVDGTGCRASRGDRFGQFAYLPDTGHLRLPPYQKRASADGGCLPSNRRPSRR